MKIYNGIERPDFTPDYITELKPDEVFVFGSNLAGMHSGGAIGLENVCLPETFVKVLK